MAQILLMSYPNVQEGSDFTAEKKKRKIFILTSVFNRSKIVV